MRHFPELVMITWSRPCPHFLTVCPWKQVEAQQPTLLWFTVEAPSTSSTSSWFKLICRDIPFGEMCCLHEYHHHHQPEYFLYVLQFSSHVIFFSGADFWALKSVCLNMHWNVDTILTFDRSVCQLYG